MHYALVQPDLISTVEGDLKLINFIWTSSSSWTCMFYLTNYIWTVLNFNGRHVYTYLTKNLKLLLNKKTLYVLTFMLWLFIITRPLFKPHNTHDIRFIGGNNLTTPMTTYITQTDSIIVHPTRYQRHKHKILRSCSNLRYGRDYYEMHLLHNMTWIDAQDEHWCEPTTP